MSRRLRNLFSYLSPSRVSFVTLLTLVFGLMVPAAARGQAVMTVTGVSGVRYGGYDEEIGESYRWIDFTVKNTGNTGAYPMSLASCGPYTTAWTGDCLWHNNEWQTGGWLAPGQTTILSVYIALNDSPPNNGIVSLSVAPSANGWQAGAFTDVGRASYSTTTTTATFLPPPLTDYRPTVTPKASTELLPLLTPFSRTFTIQNSGSRIATYALTYGCDWMTSCTANKTSTTLAPGATDEVTVSFVSTNTLGDNNLVKLIASYTNFANQTIADTGRRPTVTPAMRPTVTPKSGTTVVANPGAWNYTFFTITVAGSGTPTFALSAICSGWATNCYAGDATPYGGGNYSVPVFWVAPTVMGNASYPTTTIRLGAAIGILADTGAVTSAMAYGKPTFSPKTSTVSDPAGQYRAASVTLTNGGNAQSEYFVSLQCTAVTSCTTPTPNVSLAPGASTTLTANYYAAALGNSGTVKFIARRDAITAPLSEFDTATVTSTPFDLYAPTITHFSPFTPEGETTYNGARQVSVTVCDAEGQVSTPTATNNGSPVSGTFTPTTIPTCATAKTGSFSFTAQPGANTFVLSVNDGIHPTTLTRHFTYDESYDVTPVVTPLLGMRLLRDSVTWADTFTVHNPGPVAATYAVTAWCTAQLINCHTPMSSLTVGAGQTVKLPASYRTTTSGPLGIVFASVQYTGIATGRVVIVNNIGTQIYIDPYPPTITYTHPLANATVDFFPDIGLDVCDPDWQLGTLTVTLDGVTLSGGTLQSISVPGCYTAWRRYFSQMPVSLGTHTVSATVTDVAGHVTTKTHTFTLALPPVAEFRPDVTPKNAAPWLIPHPQTQAWAVRNVGTRNAKYHIVADCSAITTVAGCSLDKNDFTLAPNAVDTVRVSFAMADLPTTPRTLKLIAAYTDIVGRVVADTGVLTAQIPTMAMLYQPQVQVYPPTLYFEPAIPPNPPADPVGNAKLRQYSFALTNFGVAPVTYTMDVELTNGFGIKPWNPPDPYVTVQPGQMVWYPITIAPPPSSGTRGIAKVTASYTWAGHGTVSASATAALVTQQTIAAISVRARGDTVRVARQVDAITFDLSNLGNHIFAGKLGVRCSPRRLTNCRWDSGSGYWPDSIVISAGPGQRAGATVLFSVNASGAGSTDTIFVEAHGTTDMYTAHASTQVIIRRDGQFKAVSVTPHDASQTIAPNRTVRYPFTVTNVGTLSENYNYFVRCLTVISAVPGGSTSCAGTSDTTGTLAPGQSKTVAAEFMTTSDTALSVVSLRATGVTDPSATDIGKLTVALGGTANIVVTTAALNPGEVVDRGGCLTIAAGENAAYECGDLRIVHVLPATTTMNKTRAPTLIYNSAHALGHGRVAADVTVALGVNPSALVVTLKVKNASGVVKVDTSRVIPWSTRMNDGESRRIAMAFDAPRWSLLDPGKTAGAFSYTLEARSADDGQIVDRKDGTIVVVDRSQSPFGKGWWLDGLEQLVLPTDATQPLLWVGGDGSARLYKPQSSDTWVVTPTADRPDTVRKFGNIYQRSLSNGAYVEFDFKGRHVKTRNIQGHQTIFGWDVENDLLQTISLPVRSTSAARTYNFYYSGNLRLTSVVAPSAGAVRQVAVRPAFIGGEWVVDRITDADGKPTGFGFDARNRVSSRVNRRSFTTQYDYDAGGALSQSRLLMAGTGDNIINAFCASETAGLATCADTIPRSSTVRTTLDGPRAVNDVTTFTVDRFGAPTTIVNALGYTTKILREDPHWPLLATSVIQPNKYRVDAKYDPLRAVILESIAINPVNTGNATTQYFWKADSFNLVDSIKTATGEVTKFGYNINRDREWQEDRRGLMSRVTFTYNADRQPYTVTTPGNSSSQVDKLEYDTYGNLWKQYTPSGTVTEFIKDAIGRDTLVKTPTDTLQRDSLMLSRRIVYDASERDSISIEFNRADSLIVTSLYDDDGNMIDHAQRGRPNSANVGTVIRRFVYDGAGRQTSERLVRGSPGVEEEIFHSTYDAAGNLITGGRNAYGAVMTYDELNRVKTRSGTLIANFTYDETGMRTANNEAAQISRSYYPNGQLQTETQRIAKADWSGDFSAHAYTLNYTYDLSGRRLSLGHPSQLAAGTTGQTTFAYHPDLGSLSSITDKFGQLFTYAYDAAGRLNTQQWRVGSNPATEIRTYDADSRLKERTLRIEDNTVLQHDLFVYDGRSKPTNVFHTLASAARDTFTYDVRGRVLKSVLGSTSETMELDALGNAVTSNTKRGRPGVASSFYEPGSGRLRLRTAVGFVMDDTTTYDIDSRGNTYHTQQLVVGGPYLSPGSIYYDYLTFRTNTNDTFDDAGKLISHTLTYDTLFHQGPYNRNGALASAQYQSQEQYRYDALGRRVWTRSIKGATCNSSTGSPDKWTGCHNTLTRTIWDGSQILYEIRTDGSASAAAETLENDSPTGIHTGVVGYVHGYGIDEPVALDKNGTQVLPFADARGKFVVGLCGNVQCSSTAIKFPQRNLFGAANWVGNLPSPSWYGSLIEGQVDASGYVYRRNRYLDPETGRFTQEDPIGLAGGLNLYGFADGDPVNFGDPFGLCPFCVIPVAIALEDIAATAIAGTIAWMGAKWAAEQASRTPIYVQPDEGEEAAAHAGEAQAAGKPTTGVVDRAGADARRKERLRGVPTVPGLDRDEYPPAVIKPDATGVSIKHIPRSDNRRSGRDIGQQIKGLKDGTLIEIKVGPRPLP